MTQAQTNQNRANSANQAYVIEVAGTQAGLVARSAGERFFTFISASSAYHRLDGQRFATPIAAELAARQLGTRRGQGALRLAS